MADGGVGIPVYFDIEGAGEEAAKRTPKAMKPLEDQVNNVSKRISNSIQKMQKTAAKATVEGVDIRELDDKMTKYANSVRLAAQQMMKLGQEQGKVVAGRVDIQAVNAQMSVLANQWKSMQLKSKFTPEGNLRVRAQELVNKMNTLSAKTIQFGNALNQSSKNGEDGAKRVNKQLNTTQNRLASLIKNSLRLVAIHSASRFIRKVREVTAEFEMQRVALAGIIQDSAEAESLFKRIKAAAIKSPFEIKDLVSFTKQLSAYRIETDKLFDVTMQLADVSAGLGVDMSRLVLAYGQVRAASVLRGQELRQFTEAGIPLVELLAEKFRELGREGTTTADVFELISKRAVPFKMIEEIFNDMTSAGGAFYKMQERQSETLKGQWMKLKDALSIMYDEMGNTDAVHGAMEDMLSGALRLIQNWRKLAGVIAGVGAALGVVEVISVFLPKFTKNTTLARKAWEGLASSFKSAGTWVGLVLSALGAVIGYLISARKEAQRLDKEIQEARTKGDTQIEQSIRNFQRLADAAVTAASGSAEQRDALKELQRTYGDIIPTQDLQIEKLREMKGNYDAVTRAIEEKIQAQVHEQNVNQIQETYGNRLATQQKRLRDYLMDNADLSTEEAARVISGITSAVKDGTLSLEQSYEEMFDVIERIAREQVGEDVAFKTASATLGASNMWNQSYLRKIIDLTGEYNDKLRDENDYFKGLNNSLGIYSDIVKELRKNASRLPEGFTLEQVGSFEYNQALWKQRLNDYKEALTKMFKDVDISEAFETPGTINFEKIIEHISTGEGTGTLKKAVNELQKDYLNFAPQERTTRLVTEAAIKFADSVGVSMTRVQGYLKKDGQKMDEYAKSVKDALDAQKLRLQTKEFEYKNWSMQADWVRPTKEDIENEREEVQFLEKLLAFVQEFLKQKTTGGSGQDPWVILIKNRMKFMQDFQKGVEDMDKYLHHSASLDFEREIMRGRGASMGIGVNALLGTPEELRRWYESAIKEVVGKLNTMGGREFAGLGVTEILAKDLTGRKIQKYQDLLRELWKGLTDFDTQQMKKLFEDQMKRLKDDLKRSETVRNFYNDILEATGDKDIATSITMSVYGDIGKDFKERLQTELNNALGYFDEKGDDSLWSRMALALQTADWDTIFKYMDRFPKEWQERLKEMRQADENYEADYEKDFIKRYQKTKTYAERIATLENQRKTALEDAEKRGKSPEQQAAVTAYWNKQIANVQLEALKDTYTWTKAFEDLEGVSSDTLQNLIKLIDEYITKYGKDLEPQQLKELTSAKERAKQQYIERDAIKSARKAFDDLTKARGRSLSLLLKGQKGTEDYTRAMDDAMEAAKRFAQAVEQLESDINSLISTSKDLFSTFASDKDAQYFSEQMENLSKAIGGGAKVAIGAARIGAGDVTGVMQLISGLGDVISGIGGGVNSANLHRLNEQIEDQTHLLEDLEYTYGRLDAAMADSFGSDYIHNYQEQLRILAAEAEAYAEQARLEREKGKKADDEKIREYERSERETIDKIREKRSELSEFFSGTDLTSAAKDFASAWIEAYRQFGNTTDAMGQKFKDMVDNMIINSLAAQAIQKLLKPIFDAIDIAAADGKLTANDIASISELASSTIPEINNAMTNLMTQLAHAGINMREDASGLTGISRDIQGASESSINGLAAGINTQNFYISHIDSTVTAILSAMTGGSTVTNEGATGAVTNPYQTEMLQYAGHIPTIDQNLASLLSEVRKVVRPNGAAASHYVSVKM